MDVNDWLLDSDPAIRWQVMQDVVGAPTDAVAAERARVATEGWGAQLLAMQDHDGVWGIADQQPDMVTMRVVTQLRELGLDPHSAQARHAIGLLRDSEKWLTMLPEYYAYHGRPFFSGETEPCINGRIVAAGAYFGANVSGVVERLLGEQMADGGWNCEQERGSVRGSFGSTINVLEGFLLYERAAAGASGAAAADVERARRKGEEYLLSRGLLRRASTGEVIDPDFQRFSYPTGYHYDVLRGLDYFRSAGGKPDARLGEALALVTSKRLADGRWLLDVMYDDDIAVTYETVREPSRWITLKAMRVLRWTATRD
ncbi:MAG TPA: hypothetical protein VH371_07600 [Candidatus Limnocylindrales bacterium]